MSLLRRRLFLLAAAALLPIAVIAGLGVWTSILSQRKEAARAGIELTRALATAVDAELRRSLSVVEAIATSPTLASGDFAEFRRRVARVVETQPLWHAIVVVDADGVPRVDTRAEYGAPLPALEDTESLARVHGTLAPVIGALTKTGESAAGYHFGVYAPVVRDGVLRYVVVALVQPVAILDLLQRQHVPSAWVISIFDGAGQRVARTRAHEDNLGKRGAPSVVALMARPEDEGWGVTTAVEGDEMYTAYSRVKAFGWTVATGIPTGVVDGATWRSALVFGSGFVLSIVIGVIAATLVARSITGPMRELERAATALGRRERPRIPASPIVEIRRVGEALAGAAEERTSGERERDALLTREQEARAAAEAANRAKDEFLAMLGHELRNPLGAVANAVALLDHPAVTPATAAQGRQIIARQVAHLARLTDDLLDAGRVITGKIVLDRQPLDLAELVVRALGTVDTSRHCVVRELAPVWIAGDATRLEQIVVNLVGNAVKYTPERGTITVCVGREGVDGVLRVRDDGVGMSPELAGRVFDLFVQGDRALDRAAGGLGIGLTLVRRLAELHGGSASAASAGAGQGSELVVRIPRIAAPAFVAAPAAAVLDATGTTARDVLVVEDNDDARVALCELLELGGHRVRSECDGAAGLAAALAAPPEIALIDVGLPGMDGYEVARRIRAGEGDARRVRLVALTGYGLPEDRQRAFDAGFDLHLVKPVNMTALTKLLAT